MTRITEVFEKSIFVLLIAICSISAFSLSFKTNDQFEIPKFLIIAMLSTIAALLIFLGSLAKVNIRIPRATIVIVPFFTLMLLSWLLSVDPVISLWGNYKRLDGLASYLPAVVVITGLFAATGGIGRIETLLRWIGASAFILSLYGVLQFFGFDLWSGSNFPFEQSRSFATFGNPDIFASFLSLTIPLYFYLLMIARRKFIYYLMIFTSVFAMTSTGTRAGLIALAAALILLVVRSNSIDLRISSARQEISDVQDAKGLGDPAQFNARRTIFAILGVAGAAVILVSALASGDKSASDPVARFSGISAAEGSTAQRIQILRTAAPATTAQPLLGQGSASFRFAFEQERSAEFVKEVGDSLIADNTHNLYLQYASENGILVFLFFLWPIVFIVLSIFQKDPNWSRSRRSAFNNLDPEAGRLQNAHVGQGSSQSVEPSQIVEAMNEAEPSQDSQLSQSSELKQIAEPSQTSELKQITAIKHVVNISQEELDAEVDKRLIEQSAPRLPNKVRADLLSFCLGIALVAYAIDMIFGIQTVVLSTLFWSIMAIFLISRTASLSGDGSSRSAHLSSGKKYIASALLLVMFCLTLIIYLSARNLFAADVSYKAGLGLAQNGVHQDALIYAKEASAVFPGMLIYRQNEIGSHYQIFTVLKDRSDLDEGIEKSKKLLKEEPRELDHYALAASGLYTRGELLNATKDFKETVRICSAGIELSPYWVAGLRIQAKAYYKLERYREAFEAAAAALELDPTDPELTEMRDFYRANMRVKEEGGIKTK